MNDDLSTSTYARGEPRSRWGNAAAGESFLRHGAFRRWLLIIGAVTSVLGNGPALARSPASPSSISQPGPTPSSNDAAGAEAEPSPPSAAPLVGLEGLDARLAYRAPSPCPGEPAFLELVQARTETALALGAAREFVVTIEAVADGYEGTFKVRQDGKLSDERRVAAQHCGEVVDALALVTAIALRGGAAATPAAAERAESPARSGPVPAADGQPALGAAPQPERAFEHAAGSGPSWLAPGFGQTHFETEVPAGKLSLDYRVHLDLHVGATWGLLPGVAIPRYELSAYSALFLSTPRGAPALVGIMPRVRLALLQPTEKRVGDLRSQLQFGFEYYLGLCGTPYYRSTGLMLLGCVEYGGQVVHLRNREPMSSAYDVPGLGSGLVGATADVAYNVGAHLHLSLRGTLSYRLEEGLVRDAQGDARFALGASAGSLVGGLGFHW